ncbi:trypsin-like peptidase domain-containing protein [Saccharothrix sp. Mg75]|uniref:S1C family serine protease n=1 Tax=Saccharothrix sp. Mg75 TaxID=3445357 RepID=UPI003EF010D5
MTESEQPRQPQEPQQHSPWARGAEHGHEYAGDQQQGAGQPGPDGSAAGVDRSDAGSAGAVQGSAGRPRNDDFGSPVPTGEPAPGTSAHTSAGHPADVDPPAAAGRSNPGEAGAVQGGAGQAGQGVAGAVQGGAGRTDGGVGAVQGGPHPTAGQAGTGGFGAAQGGAGFPATGPGTGAGAWQGGFQRPEHTGPYGAAQTAVQGHPGSSAPSPSGAAQPDGPGAPGVFPGQSGPYYAPPGSVVTAPPRRGRGKVVAGVAALVLAVGGVAGGVGGYVGYEAADRSGPVANALNQAPPAQRTGAAAEGSIEQVAQKVLPTVVQVQVSGGAGSGFVLSSDGLVLTNNHVVESAAGGGPIKVQLQDGRSFDARIVGRDPTSDLAVVKAEDVDDLPVAELGNSSDLRIGQQVVAVGSPFDLNGTVTSGIVSSLNRPVRAGGEQGTQATVLNAIQTDAAINPGNSGGPLVNMQGQVVGINSAIYSPNSGQSAQGGSVGIGFAIPVDQARRTAKELSETGKATQTVLGVSVGDDEDGGALVREVTAGGAAEAAGVKAGDVITRFGDRPIDSSDALVAAVRSRAPGEKVQLTIGRDRTVEVTLGSQPVEVR